MKRKQVVTTIGLAAMTLVACASEDVGQAEEAPATIATDESQEQGLESDMQSSTPDNDDVHPLDDEDRNMTTDDDYVFITTMGAKGSLEFVDNTDQRVAQLNDFLVEIAEIDAGDVLANNTADSWKYLVANVDNNGGSEDVDMAQVILWDSDGSTYPFTNAYGIIDESLALGQVETDFFHHDDSFSITFDEYDQLQNFGYDVQEQLPRSIAPQETATFILALPADDVVIPHDLEMVTVSAHGDFDEVYAYNITMDEYEELLTHEEQGTDWDVYDQW